MTRIIAAMLAVLSAAPVLAESLPAIDWGAAGKGEAAAGEPLPEMSSADKGSGGFDCKTVTRLSHDYRGLRSDTHENLPAKVQRCSRDGFSLEMTSPSN
ncbi:hypothetical protein M8R20_17145 [Pseudomonas sp. R2.Fl]|nr:hypothetical protein [Pseudomonas sp. R2.Fl]